MQQDVTEMIWTTLQGELNKVRQQATKAINLSERSETAGAVEAIRLDEAPKAANGAAKGNILFITNVRKVGEGAGAGTGTLCYYNPADDTWRRVGDDTIATI
jgi:hypothetical protein